MPQSRPAELLGLLKKQYGTPKARVGERDPFRLIIGEMVAYLAKDDLRETAFAALRKQAGVTPQQILDAPLATLTAICRLGGPVAPQHRAERMQLAAAIVIDDFGGDLDSVLKWEYKKAVKALCTLPSVAEPGADRILMACGARPVLGLESAALRVLCRLGYGEETKNYTKTYRSARDAASAELPKNAEVMTETSLLLREHGKATCKYSAPHCEECALTASCDYFSARRPKQTSDRFPRKRLRAPSNRTGPG